MKSIFALSATAALVASSALAHGDHSDRQALHRRAAAGFVRRNKREFPSPFRSRSRRRRARLRHIEGSSLFALLTLCVALVVVTVVRMQAKPKLVSLALSSP